MKIDPDWRRVIRKTWSVRFMVLASALILVETLLPFYMESLPRGIFAGLAAIATIAGIWARVVLQREFDGD